MREEDLGRYQMLWDCPACGTQGLLGVDHRFCASCGAAQDPSLRYFPSDEQKVLVEDHAFHGADVVCPACDTPNAATAGFCVACGSPLDDAKEAAGRGDVVVDEGETFEGETAKDAREEGRQRHLDDEAARKARMSGRDLGPKKKRGFMGIGLVGGCLGLVALVIVGCIGFYALSWMFQSKDTLKVTSHQWVRTVQVETYGPKKDTAWRDEVPTGAKVLSCTQAKRDEKKVPDGEDCKIRKTDNGDGTFSEKKECTPKFRKEPVMADKCTYTVLAWKNARKEQAAGRDLSPSWPTVKLSKTGTCEGCEREGERSETYTVNLVDSKGGVHDCDLSESRWRALKDGQSVEATFGGLTGAIDCSSVK